MKEIRLYILLILCTIFYGCERIDNPDDFNGREIKLFARMGVHLTAESKTKGVINSTTNTELNIGLVRMDGDNYTYPDSHLRAKIGTPDAKNNNLRNVTDFSTAQFFQNAQSLVKYAAWYPDTGTYNSSGRTVTFNIDGDSDIMYSNVVEGKMSTGFDVMQFKHALSLFRIHVYKSTDLDWGNLTSVSITGLPDVCTVTLPENASSDHAIAYSKSTDAGLTLSSGEISSPIPTGFENKDFIREWIAAPTGTEDPGIKVLNMSVTTAGGESETTGTDTVAVAGNFKPGFAYDIVLRFSDNNTVNADVQISDWEDGINVNSDVESSDMFYNLSANGTANCYIVSSANFSYCFDATVKGNGSTAAMPGSRLDPTLSPVRVGIIWADGINVGESVTFQLETEKIVEGKVMFKIIGDNDKSVKTLREEGNVLLGVYDEGDNCLWTWHIWITDKPQKQNYKDGYIALDRNLGATAAAPGSTGTMNGLFYQWGRPTPFHLTNGSKVDATNSYTRVTPDEAVANPKIFYGRFNNTTDGAQSEDESTNVPGNYHDWVDRSKFSYVNNLWGYREEEHEQPIKTMYDPCPPGYHVPYARTWEKLDRYPHNMNGNTWPPANGVYIEIEGNEIWYPYQGFINKDGEYKTGHIHLHDNTAEYSKTQIVEMWSALINRHDADDIKGDLTGENEKINDSPYRFMFNKDDFAKLSDEYTNRTRGLAVRCVSNNTADVVKNLSASQTSNCYMVHEDGYYKFKATVRGNGVGSLLPLGGTTTAEINGGLSTTISPTKVDILWWQGDFTKGTADFPTVQREQTRTTPPSNMCLSLLDNGYVGTDGYVAFQISGFSKGNVVLAAYDEIGTILWTWHIWLTDKPVDKISGNYTKMDRFLGATFAPTLGDSPAQIAWSTGAQQATLGFYYQWGKKDPIIGPPSYNSGTDNSQGSTVASSGWWEHNNDGNWRYRTTIDVKDKAAITEVVKNPTAFYKSTTTGNATTSQWFPESFADGYTNVALWGYAVANYSIQGQTFSKTMHDPCPPGYRTPFHFSWRYDGNNKYAEGDAGEDITYLTSLETGWNDYGIVTNKGDYFEKMWFPCAGYRNPLTGACTEVGEGGYMNTGMPMGQYNTRSFWYNSKDGTNNQVSYTGQTGQYAGRHGSAYGKMIRCMKE